MTDARGCRLPPSHCALCELRQQGAFKPMDAAAVSDAYHCRQGVTSVAAGRAILQEGVADHRLFTVFDGWAFRYQTLRDGSRQILNFLLPGDLIGLQAEFTADYAYGVEALTDVGLCVFTVQSMRTLFREQPDVAYDMTWRCASEEKLVDENLVSVGARDALGKLAALLIQLWRRADAVGMSDASGAIPFPLTQQHMADALGLSLVHTNKRLRLLQQLGLYDIADGRLVIHDLDTLAHVAQYDLKPLRKLRIV